MNTIRRNLEKKRRKLEAVEKYIDERWDKLRDCEKVFQMEKEKFEREKEDFEQEKNEWLFSNKSENDVAPTQTLDWELDMWIEHYEESSSLGE